MFEDLFVLRGLSGGLGRMVKVELKQNTTTSKKMSLNNEYVCKTD